MAKRKKEFSSEETNHTVVNLKPEDDIGREMTEMRKKINELCEENEYFSMKQNRFRARSVTVGTAFGGIPEIVLRSDGATVHAQMQPTEVVELIEQLAAGVGVEVAMRPKQNFASWRGWEEVIQQRVGFDQIAWKGAAAWQMNGENIERTYQELTGNTNYQLPEKHEMQKLESGKVKIEEVESPVLPESKNAPPRKTRKLRTLKDQILGPQEETNG